MTPPKAPPAPPSAKELVGAPTSAPTLAPLSTVNQQLIALSKEIDRIARAIPTPNVTDSKMHGAYLEEIAAKIRALANG